MRSKKEIPKRPPIAPFAPIHIHWDLMQTERLASLYKFGRLVFPGMPFHGMAKTLLDLENEMRRVFLNVPPEERGRLQEGLAGLTLEFKLAIKEGSSELFSLPIRIDPALVVERAILGKGKTLELDEEIEALKRTVFDFIQQEIKKKVQGTLERFFSKEVTRAGRWAVGELVKLGALTRGGRLKRETTIEDLLSGKYSDLFAKAVSREVINEGLLIQQTLAGLYEWAELGPEAWAAEARKELDLIGRSLNALKS